MQSTIKKVPMTRIQSHGSLAISLVDRDVDRCVKVIRHYGVLKPLVLQASRDGNHRVLSGECELEALRELGATETSAVVVPVEDTLEADKISLLLLSLRQTTHALSEGLILKELLSSGEVNQRELASLLGKSVSWVSKRLSLVQRLSEGVVHLVSARQLCPQTAQEIARLPSEVQADFAHRVIRDHVPKSSVERLVSVFNAPHTPESLKQAILRDPKKARSLLPEELAVVRKKSQDPEEYTRLLRLQSGLMLLFKLIAEVEGLLVSLTAEQIKPRAALIKHCQETIARFARLVTSVVNQGTVSPGKQPEGGLPHDH
jgi:ParB family chromosome partitioning protein